MTNDTWDRDYELLCKAGHSPAKAIEILLDAGRGDQFAKDWIEMIREVQGAENGRD